MFPIVISFGEETIAVKSFELGQTVVRRYEIGYITYVVGRGLGLPDLRV